MRALLGALTLVVVAACTASASSSSSSTTPTPSSIEPIATDRLLAELELETLARVVSNLRGLDFLQPVTVEIVDDADYRNRVNELAAAPLDIDPDRSSSWLRLLGALPEGTNRYSAISRLLQSTAAFHDPVNDRVMVRAGAGIDPFVESVVVHELVHALQIQHFGQPAPIAIAGDVGYVYSAITEGDAQRITQRFIGSLTQQDEGRYEEGRLAAAEDATAIRASAPPYVLASLARPAQDGALFLQTETNTSVDAYLTDLVGLTSLPPTSEALVVSEADTTPLPIELRPVTVLPYEPLRVQTDLGAGPLRLLLETAVPNDLVGAAVAGWGGDALDIRVAGDDVIFAYAYRGESPEDAEELAAAFGLLMDTRLADGAYASIRRSGDSVLVLAASDPEVRSRLDELFADFGDEDTLIVP